MRYYVVSDVHGYFSELKETLIDNGFFDNTNKHKLIICGDIFDRGPEALALQDFILNLMEKDEIILIKGNHEDLAVQLLNEWSKGSYMKRFHYSNGTIDTFFQLTKTQTISTNAAEIGRAFMHTPYIQKIIPTMLDYYETNHYIFTHGWIPCTPIKASTYLTEYLPIDNWRNADKSLWDKARWINGMVAAKSGVIEQDKTIVCGHWHCSFGHSYYEGDGGEFENNPNFNPYYAEGIIAIDACTTISKKVNCIIIDD